MIRLLLLLALQTPAFPGAVDYPRPRFRTDSLATQLVQGWANRAAKPIACVWGHVATSPLVGRYLLFDSLYVRLLPMTPTDVPCLGAVALLKFIEPRPAGMADTVFLARLQQQLTDLLPTRPDLLLLGVVHDTLRKMLTVPGDSTGQWQRPEFFTVPRVFWILPTTRPPMELPSQRPTRRT